MSYETWVEPTTGRAVMSRDGSMFATGCVLGAIVGFGIGHVAAHFPPAPREPDAVQPAVEPLATDGIDVTMLREGKGPWSANDRVEIAEALDFLSVSLGTDGEFMAKGGESRALVYYDVVLGRAEAHRSALDFNFAKLAEAGFRVLAFTNGLDWFGYRVEDVVEHGFSAPLGTRDTRRAIRSEG